MKTKTKLSIIALCIPYFICGIWNYIKIKWSIAKDPSWDAYEEYLKNQYYDGSQHYASDLTSKDK